MPEQELRVKVNCDTLLEPVAEWRDEGEIGEHYFNAYGSLCVVLPHTEFGGPRLFVTPKEPEVSEPKYTIPVEVPKAVWENYSGGIMQSYHALPHRFSVEGTPRVQPYEFPPELRVSGVYGIAADFSDDEWSWFVHFEEPARCRSYWDGCCIEWHCAKSLIPTLGDPPTPEQCNNDWKQSLFLNPDYKAE